MPLTRLLIAVEKARQAAIRRGLDEDAAISSIMQDADVAREVDAVARERAHGQWLVNYLRDQDAPHDFGAAEKAARKGVLAEITKYLRESWG